MLVGRQSKMSLHDLTESGICWLANTCRSVRSNRLELSTLGHSKVYDIPQDAFVQPTKDEDTCCFTLSVIANQAISIFFWPPSTVSPRSATRTNTDRHADHPSQPAPQPGAWRPRSRNRSCAAQLESSRCLQATQRIGGTPFGLPAGVSRLGLQ